MAKKYVASRRDICAGKLNLIKIAANEVNTTHKIQVKKSWEVCRGILFNVNEEGLARDLIYATPTNYPIIRDKHHRFGEEVNFGIDHYVELDELLKYMKYGVDLTQGDLNRIFMQLVANDRWLRHHKKVFGIGAKEATGKKESMSGIQPISMETYNALRGISMFKEGRPSEEEPGYSFKKRRS